MGSGVKEVRILEDLDSYWDDINDRLTISRMVSDSVIKGMVHAVEQEAAEKVVAKELEVTSLKESLYFLDVGANKIELYEPENMNYGQCLSLSNDYVEHDKMRESLSSLRYAAKEQFNRLKKEIDGIRGRNSIRSVNSGSELVGFGGILKEKENEIWIVVMQSLIRSLQEEFEEKLWEQIANFCGSQSVNWLDKFNEISGLCKELDMMLKLLPNHETGVSLGSGDVDHSHRKVLNNHISFSTQHPEGNGKVGEPETGVSEVIDAAHIKHLTKDDLVKHFNTTMTNAKSDHESTVHQMAEEIMSLKGKILNERGSSLPNRKDKEFDVLKKKIPGVILKLDGIIVDSEKVPALCDNTLGSLKDKLGSLHFENHQLRDSLRDEKNEEKCLSSRVSEAEGKMLQHSSLEKNFSRLLANLNSSLEDTSIEASVREEVYKCVLRELSDRIQSDRKEFDVLKKKIPQVIRKSDGIIVDNEKLPALCVGPKPSAQPSAQPNADFLARAAARCSEKKKVVGDAPDKSHLSSLPTGKLVIREPQVAKPSQPPSGVSEGKRKAKATVAETLPTRAEVDSSDEIWYPSWDLRKRDSLFSPNEGGRFMNTSPFEAFLLPRDKPLLAKADVEESFGASMGYMSRALAYFASGTCQLSELMHQYRELEKAAETAQKLSKEAFDQRDHAREENKQLFSEVEALKKENGELKQRLSKALKVFHKVRLGLESL